MTQVVRRLQVFGKSLELVTDGSDAGQVLLRELSLYPESTARTPAIRVEYGAIPTPVSGLRNPSIHHDLDDGFLCGYGDVSVSWRTGLDVPIVARMHARDNGGGARGWLRRMRNIQFSSSIESVGQSVHELVLVPSVYFDPDYFLLHASALEAPSGGVIAIGGTGGVGKTSLEIELCSRRGYRFVADDITVVDSAGHAWSNLAYPKIYAYNVRGDEELTRRVMHGRGYLDRMNWRLLASRDPAGARRRMPPQALYGDYSRTGGALVRYIFLARERRRDYEVRQVSAEELARMSVAILKSEYVAFHQHLYWHEVNRRLRRAEPVLRADEVFASWTRLATSVLTGVECVLVSGPIEVEHSAFVRTVASIVEG